MPEPESSGSTAVDPTLAYFDALFRRLGVEWCVAGAVAANATTAPPAEPASTRSKAVPSEWTPCEKLAQCATARKDVVSKSVA